MCLVDTICVPVTLLSLLHCLSLPRRLAAGQRRPVEETPFHLEACAPGSAVLQRDRACVEIRPDLATSPPRNNVQILFSSVGDLFTHRSRFLLPTNFILQEWGRVGSEMYAWLLALVSWWGGWDAGGVFEYLSQRCPCVLVREKEDSQEKRAI